MAIKKYRVEVVRTDEYEIEIDDAIYTDEVIEQWSEHFYDTDEDSRQEDFAKHLASSITSGGKANWLEGFGFIKQRHHSMVHTDHYTQFSPGPKKVTEEQYSPGVVVSIINYDDDYLIETFKTVSHEK